MFKIYNDIVIELMATPLPLVSRRLDYQFNHWSVGDLPFGLPPNPQSAMSISFVSRCFKGVAGA